MESENLRVGKSPVGLSVVVHERKCSYFLINASFRFYMVVKFPLPSQKEKFAMIQLYNKYLLELSFLKYLLNLNEHPVC